MEEEDEKSILGSEEEPIRCSNHITDLAISSGRESKPF